jgi:hypothetical protein
VLFLSFASNWPDALYFLNVKLTTKATDEVGVLADRGKGCGHPRSFTVPAFRFVDEILESFLI